MTQPWPNFTPDHWRSRTTLKKITSRFHCPKKAHQHESPGMKSSTKNQAWSVFKRKGGHLFNKKIPQKGNLQFPKLKSTHVNMSFIYTCIWLQQFRGGKKHKFSTKKPRFFFNTQVTHRKHPARPICCRRCSNLDIRVFWGSWFDKNHLEMVFVGLQVGRIFATFLLGGKRGSFSWNRPLVSYCCSFKGRWGIPPGKGVDGDLRHSRFNWFNHGPENELFATELESLTVSAIDPSTTVPLLFFLPVKNWEPWIFCVPSKQDTPLMDEKSGGQAVGVGSWNPI